MINYIDNKKGENNMVVSGDVLFHWRYGKLTVTKLVNNEGRTYVHTKVNDLKGIRDDPSNLEVSRLIREEEKVFNMDSIGYWLHHNELGAILNNRNNDAEFFDEGLAMTGDKQGQVPYAMQFPLSLGLFHKIYEDRFNGWVQLKKEIGELDKKLKKVQKDIKDIPNKYRDKRGKVREIKEKVITEILKLELGNFITDFIDKYKDGEDYLNKIHERYLSQEEFSWKDSHGYAIKELKKDYDDDDEYNDIVESGERLLKKLEEDYSKHQKDIREAIKSIYTLGEDEPKELKDLLREYDNDLSDDIKQRSEELNTITDKVINELEAIFTSKEQEDKKDLDTKKNEIEKNIRENKNILDLLPRLENEKYISPSINYINE